MKITIKFLNILCESSKKENRNIIKKFDASSDEKEDKYNVLVATDTIAEGYNLNRLGPLLIMIFLITQQK